MKSVKFLVSPILIFQFKHCK